MKLIFFLFTLFIRYLESSATFNFIDVNNTNTFDCVQVLYQGSTLITNTSTTFTGFATYYKNLTKYNLTEIKEIYGGIIALITTTFPYEPEIRYCLDFNVSCIILGDHTKAPGAMEFQLDFSNTTNFTIPIFAVNNDAQLIIDNHSRACPLCNMTVVVVADEPNTWRLLLTNMIFVPIFVQVILLLCSFGILGYSAYIYYLFIKYSGFRINVSQVCLVLEAISCIFKIIWLLFDPFWAFKEDIPPWFNTALETSWIPFTFGSNLLIPFYWNEILGNNMKVTPFLSKLKILFIILFILSIIF